MPRLGDVDRTGTSWDTYAQGGVHSEGIHSGEDWFDRLLCLTETPISKRFPSGKKYSERRLQRRLILKQLHRRTYVTNHERGLSIPFIDYVELLYL